MTVIASEQRRRGKAAPSHDSRSVSTTTSPSQFTELHRAIVLFEANPRAHLPSKTAAVKERFGMAMTSYYSLRAWVIEQPEAMQIAPALVRSLRAHALARTQPRPSTARNR